MHTSRQQQGYSQETFSLRRVEQFYRVNTLYICWKANGSNGTQGSVLQFDLSSNSTVAQLKKEIDGRQDLKLVYKQQELIGHKTLGCYGLGLNSSPREPLYVSIVPPMNNQNSILRMAGVGAVDGDHFAHCVRATPQRPLPVGTAVRQRSHQNDGASSHPGTNTARQPYVPPSLKARRAQAVATDAHTQLMESFWTPAVTTAVPAVPSTGARPGHLTKKASVESTGSTCRVTLSDEDYAYEASCWSPVYDQQKGNDGAVQAHRAGRLDFSRQPQYSNSGIQRRPTGSANGHYNRFPDEDDRPANTMPSRSSSWNGRWIANYRNPQNGRRVFMRVNGQQVTYEDRPCVDHLEGTDQDADRFLITYTRDRQRRANPWKFNVNGQIECNGGVWTKVSDTSARHREVSPNGMYARRPQTQTRQHATSESWRNNSTRRLTVDATQRTAASSSAPRVEGMTAAEEDEKLTRIILEHVISTYKKRPVPTQPAKTLPNGETEKRWEGLRLSDLGIYLSQQCSDLRKAVMKRKKLKDLLVNRDELFLVNTGKGKKNNPYVYTKGTKVPFPCPFLEKEGECTFGGKCHYSHDMNAHAVHANGTVFNPNANVFTMPNNTEGASRNEGFKAPEDKTTGSPAMASRNVREQRVLRERRFVNEQMGMRERSAHNKTKTWADRVTRGSEQKHTVKRNMAKTYTSAADVPTRNVMDTNSISRITQTPRKEQK